MASKTPLHRLKADYPWIHTPLIIGAPMRLIALPSLAVEISKAGGLGFIGAGTDVSDLDTHLEHARELLQEGQKLLGTTEDGGLLPVGVGFIRSVLLFRCLAF